MIYAYDEMYLDDAMKNLGEAADYAASCCNLNIDTFFELFIATGIASQFEKGNPRFVSGFSGTELVYEIIDKAGLEMTLPPPQIEYDYSSSYWCGWIIAYYQWRTGKSFKNIISKLSAGEIENTYPALHEASEIKAFDTLNRILEMKATASRLQILRKNCGLSQRVLSEKSGVNLRTLQQYEIRAKDINKAAVETLLALATVIGCSIADLMEI